MTNDTVPDTGLIEALRPIKTGGAGSQERPACSNCPCGTKDSLGSGGVLVCTRYPPEMTMMVKQVMGSITQVPNVGFKPVHEKMVCWEHPVLQARMRRAVAAKEARMAADDQRVVYPVGNLTGKAQEHANRVLDQSFRQTCEAEANVPVHAVGDDGSKPSDSE